MNRRFERIVLWLALLASLLGALMPSALRVASATTGDRVVAICSGFGIKQVQVAGNANPAPQSTDQSSADQCEYCLASQQASTPALMEKTIPATAAITGLFFYSPASSRVFDPGWPLAQPRAPPAYS